MNIEKRPSPNFYDLDEKAYIIILHTTLGSYEGTIQELTKRGNPSAHFVIGRDARVARLVPMGFGAWHAGVINNPSIRAKAVCRKNIWGQIKNPNRYSIGIEHAAGWDIDRDGVIESWEQLFNPAMIKRSAELILYIEKTLNISFPSKYILTHRDITSYKPYLEIQRSMIISTLNQMRGLNILDSTSSNSDLVFKDGATVAGKVVNKKIIIN